MTSFETYDPDKHNRDTPQETFGPVVKIDRHEDGQIFVITLNRPHRLNLRRPARAKSVMSWNHRAGLRRSQSR